MAIKTVKDLVRLYKSSIIGELAVTKYLSESENLSFVNKIINDKEAINSISFVGLALNENLTPNIYERLAFSIPINKKEKHCCISIKLIENKNVNLSIKASLIDEILMGKDITAIKCIAYKESNFKYMKVLEFNSMFNKDTVKTMQSIFKENNFDKFYKFIFSNEFVFSN